MSPRRAPGPQPPPGAPRVAARPPASPRRAGSDGGGRRGCGAAAVPGPHVGPPAPLRSRKFPHRRRAQSFSAAAGPKLRRGGRGPGGPGSAAGRGVRTCCGAAAGYGALPRRHRAPSAASRGGGCGGGAGGVDVGGSPGSRLNGAALRGGGNARGVGVGAGRAVRESVIPRLSPAPHAEVLVEGAGQRRGCGLAARPPRCEGARGGGAGGVGWGRGAGRLHRVRESGCRSFCPPGAAGGAVPGQGCAGQCLAVLRGESSARNFLQPFGSSLITGRMWWVRWLQLMSKSITSSFFVSIRCGGRWQEAPSSTFSPRSAQGCPWELPRQRGLGSRAPGCC